METGIIITIYLNTIINDIVRIKHLNYWEIQGRLIDDDYSSVLDEDACQIGMLTRFQSNSMPEMHKICA